MGEAVEALEIGGASRRRQLHYLDVVERHAEGEVGTVGSYTLVPVQVPRGHSYCMVYCRWVVMGAKPLALLGVVAVDEQDLPALERRGVVAEKAMALVAVTPSRWVRKYQKPWIASRVWGWTYGEAAGMKPFT